VVCRCSCQLSSSFSGLPRVSSGTKAALIARLEEYEAVAGTRHSSSSPVRATDAPGNPQSARLAESFFAVDIPQVIEPNREPEVQIVGALPQTKLAADVSDSPTFPTFGRQILWQLA